MVENEAIAAEFFDLLVFQRDSALDTWKKVGVLDDRNYPE